MSIKFAEASTFDNLVREDDFVIVDFFSTSCGPCKILSTFLEDLEAELPFLSIVKVNTMEAPELAERFEIHAVPTLFFYQGGELKERHLGVLDEDELRERIERYLY
ncbi:MAG: thioredoxin family protein [Oscillospiraceae bacterium]|nr:thioredoxin family protein [Oscillospiraceae bacterium]